MNRREFLCSAAAGASLGSLNAESTAERVFEIQTHIEILKPGGSTRIWVPALLGEATPYQRTFSNKFELNGGRARLVKSSTDALNVIAIEFPADVKPVVTVTSRAATRNYSVDLARPAVSRTPNLAHFLRPTKLIPTDGIVKSNADRITKDASTDIQKARAIYDWIVDNTFRDPKVLGCGRGDIRFMLESNNLGGKCADLNALYVGLARAAGLPARDVYGIRVAKSEMEAKCLGTSSEVVTKSQHCRAEVWLSGFGWVPVDPADVRKVVLEEPPGNRSIEDPIVKSTRGRLFGSWEMNWVAYNFAHDVKLPGSTGAPLGFLMYPQAETSDGRLDCLDPATFTYQITARRIS